MPLMLCPDFCQKWSAQTIFETFCNPYKSDGQHFLILILLSLSNCPNNIKAWMSLAEFQTFKNEICEIVIVTLKYWMIFFLSFSIISPLEGWWFALQAYTKWTRKTCRGSKCAQDGSRPEVEGDLDGVVWGNEWHGGPVVSHVPPQTLVHALPLLPTAPGHAAEHNLYHEGTHDAYTVWSWSS